MNTLKINSISEMPKNYTGNVEYRNGTKYWYKEGKCHREDGPAVEYTNGEKEWWIEDNSFNCWLLELIIKGSIFLGTKKGKYDLHWLRFFTERGIKEFPIIPGMKENKEFKGLFQTFHQTIGATIP